MSEEHHELVGAFEGIGLRLSNKLREMLDNHPSHCTDRRGCGLTQATRLIATLVHRPRDPLDISDLSLFEQGSSAQWERMAIKAQASGVENGWRRIHLAPKHGQLAYAQSCEPDWLFTLPSCLEEIRDQLCLEESTLYLDLMCSLLLRTPSPVPALPAMIEKPEIGSCSQAEEFFLEIAHGRIRRGGQVNVFVDATGRPILVEKMRLGESHSAISIEPVSINDVLLPAGSLFALRYADDGCPTRDTPGGHQLALRDIAEARFLRFTTLIAAPEWRRRAFKAQVDAQVRSKFLSPCTTTLDDLRKFASGQVAKRS